MSIRAALLGAAVAVVAIGAPVAVAVANTVPGAGGCPIFPADNVWHADISSLPVHARSAAWLASASAASTRLHPDFGPSGSAQPYGLPYTVVDGSHSKVTPSFQYADESDKGPYPFGPDTPIEGGSDRHALMVDKDACVLSELYDANWNNGSPTAGSGAVFDLRSNRLRPAGWTSADAAGLPILPGLLRLDEVRAGNVDHAIRFTVQRTDRSYLWPARHQAGSASDPNLPPMGARFRLRGGFDMTGYRPDTQVVLRAMQRYGLFLADNGSNWYFQGTAENGWDDELIADLKRVPASAFEAVDESSLMVDPNSAQVRGGAGSAGGASSSPAAPKPAPRSPSPSPSSPTTPTPPPTNVARGAETSTTNAPGDLALGTVPERAAGRDIAHAHNRGRSTALVAALGVIALAGSGGAVALSRWRRPPTG